MSGYKFPTPSDSETTTNSNPIAASGTLYPKDPPPETTTTPRNNFKIPTFRNLTFDNKVKPQSLFSSKPRLSVHTDPKNALSQNNPFSVSPVFSPTNKSNKPYASNKPYSSNDTTTPYQPAKSMPKSQYYRNHSGNYFNSQPLYPQRLYNTMNNTNTNSGANSHLQTSPFSPNSIFTTRRVWLKKPNGTPTTIVVHQNDIIDDLKQAVVNKFPNSLARVYDPADLSIQMDLQTRQPPNMPGGAMQGGTPLKSQSAASATASSTQKQAQLHAAHAQAQSQAQAHADQQDNQTSHSAPPDIMQSGPSQNPPLFEPVPSQPTKKSSIPNRIMSPDGGPKNSGSPANFNSINNSISGAPAGPGAGTTINTYSLINLEPDHNVWQLLDVYYPNGMSMVEALIIGIPEPEPIPSDPQLSNGGTSFSIPQYGSVSVPRNYSMYGASNTQSPQVYPGNTLTPPQHPQMARAQQQSQQQQQPTYSQHFGSISERSTTPISYTGNQQYYQPKPQYHYQTSALGQGSPNYSQVPQDRSISPSSVNMKSKSPVLNTNYHKRSLSNPPQSPVNHGGNNLKSTNPQAVLLLPKNFSLSSTGGGNTGSQSSDNVLNQHNNFQSKRLSLDENLVSKNRSIPNIGSPIQEDHQDSFSSKSVQSRNLTNIGVDITSPESAPYSTTPDGVRRDEQKGEIGGLNPTGSDQSIDTGNTENSDSASTITPGNIRDGLSVSPSPPTIVDRLNSPSRGTPSHLQNNLNLDRILSESSKIEKKEDTIGDEKKVKSVQELSKSKPMSANEAVSMRTIDNTKARTTTDKVLPSISVLVVEDNAINQAILGAFLRKHKIHYQIAKNGQEAVDKWRKGGFHLVLMDIQLPVKSGIEATKEIRYLEKINRIGVFAQHELASNQYKAPAELQEDEKLDLNIFRSPVIIVALTASSNSSVDKKNALTAGCNDYLTKPVNLVWLQNKITEWGCMQALIDFDGWRIKGTSKSDRESSQGRNLLNASDRAKSRVLGNSQSSLLAN